MLGIRGDGALAFTDRPWRDYAVDVDYRNVTGAVVVVRAQDSRTGVAYSLRPFRHYDSHLTVLDQGNVTSRLPGGLVDPPRSEAIKSMVAMTLRPYPVMFLLLTMGLVVVAVVQFVPVPRVQTGLSVTRPMRALPWLAAAGIVAGAFGVLLFLMYAYTERLPHVQDSVSYMFQGKILASGRLSAPPPPVPEVFDFTKPTFVALTDGKWASVYPFGHPLALAIGFRLGAAWLVPPLLGAASVALTFAIGRKVYSARVGLLAALLLASSPFFFMSASNFMSHNTTAFYLLGSLFLLLMTDRRPLLSGLLAGLLFGLAFNARQLEVVALVPPFGALLLSRSHPPERRAAAATQIGGFALGGLVMLVAYFLYNQATRGDPLTTGFTAAGFETTVGFGGKHSVTWGIRNEQTQMAFLLLVLNGWPQYIGLTFVLLPFVLATRTLWDWFFLACALFIIGSYTFFIGNGIMHGPRYWYPAAPFLMLLAARGAERAADLLTTGAASLRRAATGTDRRAEWAGLAAAYALVAVLIGTSISGWLLSRHIGWVADFVPAQAVSLEQFNRADDRLIRLIEGADLDNALVLVEECPIWQCYGTVFWLNSPTLDGDVVIARDLPAGRAALFQAYPDRFVYVASYASPSLVPYGATPPADGMGLPEQELPPAPRAREIVLPTLSPTPSPPPTATPDPNAAARRDEQRRRGLAAIADALEVYRARHRGYPVAGGLQSFCRYVDIDAGCALQEVLEPLPRDPTAGATYWYRSDGATFTLFASMEQGTDSSQCPQPPLPDLATVQHLYCVRGGGDVR